MDKFCYVMAAVFFGFGLWACLDDLRDWPQYFRTIAIGVWKRMIKRRGEMCS